MEKWRLIPTHLQRIFSFSISGMEREICTVQIRVSDIVNSLELNSRSCRTTSSHRLSGSVIWRSTRDKIRCTLGEVLFVRLNGTKIMFPSHVILV